MKVLFDIKRFKFYAWVGFVYFVLWLLSDISKNQDQFIPRFFNNVWRAVYVTGLNYIFFEYTFPYVNRKRTRFIYNIVLFIAAIFAQLMLYSFGLYAWRFIGIQLWVYTELTKYTSIHHGVSAGTGYGVGSLFFFTIGRHIYDYTKLKQATQQLRIEKQAAELNYLKSQTNPHFLFNTLNNIYSLSRDKSDIAPESIMRLSKIMRFNNRQTVSLAYGLHSKILPLGSYFYKSVTDGTYPNKGLDIMRAHHLVAAWDYRFAASWKLHVEAYHQQLFKVPVSEDRSHNYWMLNDLEGYATQPLVSKGKGINKGVDMTVEKFFTKGVFMIASFSVFSSTFNTGGGMDYNTRFNSKTSGSWVGAKEWSWRNNTIFQLGWKVLYNGGLPITPLSAVTNTSREPVLDDTRPYSERVPAYFRVDNRVALRKDKAKVAWQLALDVQNLLAIKNADALSRRYDPSANQWIYKTQSGLVPVLSYQIDF